MRLGLHLIALQLCCSAACELRTALRSSYERSTARSSQAAKQHSRSAIRCSPSLTKRPAAGRTSRILGARAALAAGSVRIRDGAATRRGLQRHLEPRSTSFRSAACTLSPAGHCAARGSRAHHRLDRTQPADCSGHGQQSDFLSNAQIMSSVTRYWPELASPSSFARILKAYHPFQIESYPPI